MPLSTQKTQTTGAIYPSSDYNSYVRDWFNASPMGLATAKGQVGYASAAAPAAVSMANPGHFNVRTYGALGDGVTDDSTAFLNTITAAGTHGVVVIPAGTYLINIDIGNRRPVFQGAGTSETVLRSFSATGAAITVGANAGWQWGEIRDLQISGASGTRTRNGVEFGHATYQTNDEYAGRMRFKNVYFVDLDYAVRKRYGNIGNRFETCTFGNANFHVHAQSHANMHAGCDTFENCQASGAQLASYYCNSTLNGTGQVLFRGCLWDGNPGFPLFVKAFNSLGIGAELLVEDCWNENNATAASVTIDSVAYTPQFMRLASTVSATVKRTVLDKGITLVASTLLAEECVVGTATVTQDADSFFAHDNAKIDIGGPLYTRSILRASKPAGLTGAVFVVPQRTKVSHKYQSNLLAGFTGNMPVAFGGTAALTTTTSEDGLLFGAAQTLTFTGASQIEVPPQYTVAANKWVVFTAEVKKVSGDAVTEMSVGGGSALFSDFKSKITTDWTTFAGLARTSAGSSGYCPYTVGPASGTGVYRFGAVQILQFDTLQEAVEYLDSGVFTVNQDTIPREVWGTAAPTTGTWRVGDRVKHTDPVLYGHAGWVCTTAGTPGTWTKYGRIGTPPRARVYLATAQSIAQNVEVTINFDAETDDPSGWHDNATNNARITVDVAGLAVVHAQLTFASGAGTYRDIYLYKNGVKIAEHRVQPTSGTWVMADITTQVVVAAGDYITVGGGQDTAAALNVTAGTTGTYFEVVVHPSGA